MKKPNLYVIVLSLVSFLSASAEQTYSCVTSLENGTVTCSSSLDALAKAVKDKKYLLENWSTVKEELMGLLDAQSHNYNPALALKVSASLSDKPVSASSSPQEHAISKELLNMALTILVKGLQRPGHEGSKRTAEQYAEDLFSLYLMTQKYNFTNFKAGVQEELQEPTPPKNRFRSEVEAYEKAKREYQKALELQKLLNVLTRDDFTLNDLYELYGIKFSFDKLEGENEPKLRQRCNSHNDTIFKQLILPQMDLFEWRRMIESLLNLYNKYRNNGFEFGQFYKLLEAKYDELIKQNKSLTSSKRFTSEESRQILNLFGLNPRDMDWYNGCDVGFGAGVGLFNQLIDAQKDIVNKLKVKTGVKIDENADPVEYVTPSAIKEALNYNAENYPVTTLCQEMGACVVGADGQAVSIYKGQSGPNALIAALVD